MRSRVIGVLLVVLAVALLVGACAKATPTPAPKPTEAPAQAPTQAPAETGPRKIKAAWVYVGPIGDAGWTYAHDLGRKYVEQNVPGVETAYVESVPEGADAERVFRDFAEKGYDVIFGTSFGYMDTMEKLAEEYPDVVWVHVSGYKWNDTNFDNLFGRMYKMKYLAGVAAAMKTKTKKIGYIAPFPIPEVIRHINFATLGARSVDPEIEVQVVWINTWYDPPTEREAAETLLAAGADVIITGADTPGPVQAASEKGKWGMAYDSPNACELAGDGCIGVPYWNWGVAYAEIVREVQNGTFKPRGLPDSWWDADTGIVDFGFGPAADDAIKAKVNELKQKIVSGELDVAAGPIYAQNGQLAVAEGDSLSWEEIWEMKWFVQGVIGEIPGGQEPPKAEEKAAAPAEQPAAEAKPIKAAFVYVGPIGDAGWTYAHDLGRLYLEQNVPNVETAYVESVPEGADSERVFRSFAEKGYDVIFGTSFGYMDVMANLAEEYPDQYWLHCSGYKSNGKNFTNYFGRMYQPRYLSGLVAGKMTKTNKIGYVAAFPIPEVIRGINAFTLGVRKVNPDATVQVVWTNTWYDPPTEREAAETLLAAGADVIAQHQDTPAPQQAAEERGAYGIGYNSDMRSFAPKAVLTGPVWNWGVYYAKVVRDIQTGNFDPTPYWGGMAEGVVDLGPFGPMVPDDVKALVEQEKQKIISGEWDVFCGPIKDQQGNIKVAEGQCLTDEEMLSMKWFVEGVVGEIPQ